ncbi:hypothetical protein YH64_005490 [Achromobacter sp. LC458]|uniref:Uncharacterized protein n=2 Tax=Achromobacter piechaudii TaxID=72556 RepID=A0ABN7EV70_9BURK|nr:MULTISPECIES: hypothetical protein [Achromobacter]EFF78103.1 hypothetical protein HMPREF0004_0328 [Achromobacter piechaudii ATCC 43553]TRM54155.1 hypothetical protein YH64_005490 [Achromobacter sp. LC458]GLK94703.1 hypothetical protein GCM10008164_24410 [Achromobacter xylosoxidans]CAB3670252.1 hypothetical protein LMG1873_01075 [Achromobacter piechaudii]
MSELTNPTRASARTLCWVWVIAAIAIVTSPALIAIALLVLHIMYPLWPYWTEVGIWIGFAALLAFFGSVLVNDIMTGLEESRAKRRGVVVNERGVPIRQDVLLQNRKRYGRNQQS